MIKKGVIDENTPHLDPVDPYEVEEGQPTTKEAADRLERHAITDAVDAVVARTKRNRR